MREQGYRMDCDGMLAVAELTEVGPGLAAAAMERALAAFAGVVGIGLVIVWPAAPLDTAGVHEALARWAQSNQPRRGMAVVVPAGSVPAMRAISADVAGLGALVGVFSERAGAKDYALREGSIWWVDEGQWAARPVPREDRACWPTSNRQSGAALQAERPASRPS